MDNWFKYWQEKKEKDDTESTRNRSSVSEGNVRSNRTLIGTSRLQHENNVVERRSKYKLKVSSAQKGDEKQVEKEAVKGAKSIQPKSSKINEKQKNEDLLTSNQTIDSEVQQKVKGAEEGNKAQTSKEQRKAKKLKHYSGKEKLKTNKLNVSEEQLENQSVISRKDTKDITSEEINLEATDSKTRNICWKSPYEKKEICFSTVISSKERLLTSVIPENKEKENKRPIYEQLICPVCRKLFVHPQMLPCKHSFCEHCIPKKTTTKPINKHHIVVKCPVCEAETYFTSIEKVRFPDNILLVKVLSRLEEDKHGSNLTRGYRKEIYCDACDKKFKKVAVKKCISHNLNVCIDCLQKHGRSNKPGQGVVEPSINYNETKCFDHPDSNLVMYCITDKIPICEDCIFGQHKDHLIISLEEAFHNDSFDLHDAIAKYRNVKDQSENEMLSLNILKSKFQGDKALLDKEITKEFTVLHGTLQQKEKEIKDLLQKEINVREQMINDFADAKSRAIFSLDSLAEFAKEALRETNESVFLQMSCVLVEQLTEKINQILFSGKELNQSPFHGFEMNVKTISTQIEEVFEPILKSVTILKDQKVSPADKASVVNEKVVSESEFVDSEANYDSSKDQEIINKEPLEKKASLLSTSTGNNMEELSTSSNQSLNVEIPRPPTIYHHQIHGAITKIFWMVPENDTVDSFDAQIQEIQEISSSKSKSTRQIKPSIFTGIRASSFETSSLKPNSEYLFRVRAANIAGQSDWSYPYKVVMLESKALEDQTAHY